MNERQRDKQALVALAIHFDLLQTHFFFSIQKVYDLIFQHVLIRVFE